MDKDKKEELAEFDQRWNFENTVNKHGYNVSWEDAKRTYNGLIGGPDLVEDSETGENMDLFLKIQDLDEPKPGIIHRVKDYLGMVDEPEQGLTLHHETIHRFYEKLADELDSSIAEAVVKLRDNPDKLREHFGIGETSSYDIDHVSTMDTSESTFMESEELEAMIEDE
jgi:hypothetical protein